MNLVLNMNMNNYFVKFSENFSILTLSYHITSNMIPNYKPIEVITGAHLRVQRTQSRLNLSVCLAEWNAGP